MLIRHKRACVYNAGFSLIEMAMVMMILGLLLNGLFAALGESDLGRKRSQVNAQIDEIVEALYGFAQINGRLPCPASSTSSGDEATCTNIGGFVPGKRLGLPGSYNASNLLLDPWGNPYRYVVATRGISGTNIVSNAAQLKQWFANPAAANTGSWLCISDAVNCTGLVFSDTSPAVIYSMGANGSSAPSTLEAENVGTTVSGYSLSNDVRFVNAQYSDEGNFRFDDQVIWLSSNILVSRMIDAGKLP